MRLRRGLLRGGQPLPESIQDLADDAEGATGDQVPYLTGADTFALTALNAWARQNLLTLASVSAAQALLAHAASHAAGEDDAVTIAGEQITSGEVAEGRIAAAIARLASPSFTGTPAAPTAAAGTNTTQLATTAFVIAELAALIGSAPAALNTLGELSDALNDDASYAATITTALAGKQGLDATLTALAGVATAADRLPYFTGSDLASVATFTAFARTLLDDADAAAALTTLGVSTFIQTLLDDTTAIAARTTLDAASVVTHKDIASGNVDLTDAANGVAITGVSIGISVNDTSRCEVIAIAVFDMEINNAGTGYAMLGWVDVDGVAQPENAVFQGSTGARSTVMVQSRITFASTGVKTFTLRGRKTANTGTARVYATFTTLVLIVKE